MLIHKMLSKPKVLRTLMVGIWLGFLMFGVHSSKMKEKRESGCCGGNKETIKLKTQYVEIEQTLHDKEKQLEELKENMTRETDEWKRKTTQLESTIEVQSSEIEQKNKTIEDKENDMNATKIEYQQEIDEWKIKNTQLESKVNAQTLDAEQKKKNMQDKESEITATLNNMNKLMVDMMHEHGELTTKAEKEKEQFLQEMANRNMEDKENEINAININHQQEFEQLKEVYNQKLQDKETEMNATKMKYQQEMDEWKIKNVQLESVNRDQTLLVDKVQKMTSGPAIVRHVISNMIENYVGVITNMIVQYLYPSFHTAIIPYGTLGHQIDGICLSRDHQLLFTADSDQCIKVWHIESGTCVRSFLSPVRCGMTFQLYDYDGGQALLSQNKHGRVVVSRPTLSPETQKYIVEHVNTIEQWIPLAPHPDSPRNYTFSSDSQFLLAQTAPNKITAWYLPSGDHYQDFYFLTTVSMRYRTFLAVTKDHQWLISAIEQPFRITVWNFQTGEYTNEKIFYDANGIYGLNSVIDTFTQTPHCLTSDGQWIMVVFYRRAVKSCKLPQLDQTITIDAGIQNIAWCSEGQNPDTTARVIAVGDFLPRIQIWTARSDFSQAEHIYTIQDELLYHARVLTSDGKILIGAGDDDMEKAQTIIKIWDTSTGQLYDATTKSVTNQNK